MTRTATRRTATQITANGATQSYSYAGPTQDERLTAGGWTYTDSLLGTSMARGSGSDPTQFFTRDESGTLTSLRDTSGSYHYLSDGLGSIAAVTNASGAVTNRYSYDPYGVTTAQAGDAGTTQALNPWRFTGQHQDPTGLYKMGARYLQPGHAQWTQVDPAELERNPYLYATACPTNYVDPTGTLSYEEVATVFHQLRSYSKLCGVGGAVGLRTAIFFATGASTAGLGAAIGCILVIDIQLVHEYHIKNAE